jgi:hypothetical protein
MVCCKTVSTKAKLHLLVTILKLIIEIGNIQKIKLKDNSKNCKCENNNQGLHKKLILEMN